MLRPSDDEARHKASRKGFAGDFESEVNGTANICTEEHELWTYPKIWARVKLHYQKY